MLAAERNVLLEILRMYKENPCLWDQKHPHYSSRELRNRAYGLLLEKYRTVYEDATLHAMKRKIDSLRTSYKREHKKVVESKARGDFPCYLPTLWYYYSLNFIESAVSEETANSLDPSTDCDDNEEDSSHQPSRLTQTGSTRAVTSPHELTEVAFVDENEEDYQIDYEDTEEEPKPKKPNLATVHKGRKIEKERTKKEKEKDKPESYQASSSTEESEAFGKTIGLQLQQLDGFQRTVAEKLISEVIFYARLNKLSAGSLFHLNADKYH